MTTAASSSYSFASIFQQPSEWSSPSSPSSNPPVTKLLVLFPQEQCSVCQLPLENLADSFCYITSKLSILTFRILQNLDSYLFKLLFWLYHIHLSPINAMFVPSSSILRMWKWSTSSHYLPPPAKSYRSFRVQLRCPSSAKKHPLIPLSQHSSLPPLTTPIISFSLLI